jgi:hypothetical protein
MGEWDPKDMPPPVKFEEGWGIPKPDVVFQLPKEFSVPDSGMMEYQYAIVPTGFTEDKWVQMMEVRPTNRAVVHHIIAYLREQGSNYFKDQKPGVFFEAPPKMDEKTDTSALPSDFLVGYAPGQTAEILSPGQAKLIKAGTDIVFEVHFTRSWGRWTFWNYGGRFWKICHPTTSDLINIGQTNSLIPHCALTLTGDTKSRAQATDNQKNLNKPGEGR